jgi:hypothetical protein
MGTAAILEQSDGLSVGGPGEPGAVLSRLPGPAVWRDGTWDYVGWPRPRTTGGESGPLVATNPVHPVGLTSEIALVEAARRCILTTLEGDGPVVYDRVSLAKWVIENIWTPETNDD